MSSKIKNAVILLILLFTINGLKSQIAGPSASKLATYCTKTVSRNTIEFEPSFQYTHTNKYFDNNGKIKNLYRTTDSVDISSEFRFRFTYGISDNLEAGMVIPTDISTISCGMKYHIPLIDKFAIAPLIGFTVPAGNQTINKSKSSSENSIIWACGMAASYKFSEVLEIDFDTQYQNYLKNVEEKYKHGLFVNSDIGWYINNYLQPCFGLNYSRIRYDNQQANAESFVLNIGTTIEPAENFLMVISFPTEIYGKNTLKNYTISLALTITIR